MKTIGSIESFTGGAFANKIVQQPGASKYFKGCIVSYSPEIKEKLGVDTSNGVVNKVVALEMTRAGRSFLNVDFCVAFTGNAGPEALEGKPVGLVFIAINETVYELSLSGNRSKVIEQAVNFAYQKIQDILKG